MMLVVQVLLGVVLAYFMTRLIGSVEMMTQTLSEMAKLIERMHRTVELGHQRLHYRVEELEHERDQREGQDGHS
jgi:uncharacterized protein Yka (UPF0111/DUF47 family)